MIIVKVYNGDDEILDLDLESLKCRLNTFNFEIINDSLRKQVLDVVVNNLYSDGHFKDDYLKENFNPIILNFNIDIKTIRSSTIVEITI